MTSEDLFRDVEKDSVISSEKYDRPHQPIVTEQVQPGELVDFCPADDLNPLQWPTTRRYIFTLLISLCGLVSLMTASVLAPALSTISVSLSLSPESTSLTLSIYLLAFAIGPLIIGPLSEIYGRRPLWLICHAWFILWNTLCPVGKNKDMMVVGRFMSGLGGSVGSSLAGPMMADIWPIEERGKSLALSMFAPYLGAAVGPIVGGLTTQSLSWPWLFWVVSIFDAVLLVISVFMIKESYAPVLLARKALELSLEIGRQHYTIYDKPIQPEKQGNSSSRNLGKIVTALKRPFKIVTRRPILPLMSLFIAYMFGTYTIALTVFAEIWTKKYDTSIATSGLHYISISLGSAGSSLVTGYFIDLLFSHLKARSKDDSSIPEFRVPLMFPGTLLLPTGLMLYGWSAQHRCHWLITDLGMFMFVFGLMSASQCANAYLVDEFGTQYASANAAMRFLSNIVGFCFPLFAPGLYRDLGYGWGNAVLALVFVVMGVPIPWLLWKYGERIRNIGKDREG